MNRFDDIADMEGLRVRIDDLDARLMDLLAERHALIERAAQIKRGVGLPARIDARVEQVVDNVRLHAARHGLDPGFYAGLWRQLIEAAIAQEEKLLGTSE